MEMVKRMVLAVLALFVALALASPGWCGLELVEAEGSRALVSEGKIKSVSEDPEEEEMILDLGQGTLTVLDHQERVAASGTIEEYCSAVSEMAEMMERSMQRMKEQMEQQGMGDMPIPTPGLQASVEEVRVERVGSGGNIAGYATEKYEVHADGELYEEVWLARDPELLAELGDTKALARFEACASRMMGGDTVEASPEYMELMQSGWLLKSVEHGEGVAEVMLEVSRIEERSIPGSEFEVPAGYEEVPLGYLFER